AKNYFDAVEKGETIKVTRHGKVIAQIIPPSKKEPSWKNENPQLVVPGVSLSRALLADRKESR
ncbi:MAG TPA: prevent-host-death protein, partial [Candidatus Bathyarchaeia archaeon]|nr:prevent-host-death protein [Candidatus Bathyarchaeia archaeon]